MLNIVLEDMISERNVLESIETDLLLKLEAMGHMGEEMKYMGGLQWILEDTLLLSMVLTSGPLCSQLSWRKALMLLHSISTEFPSVRDERCVHNIYILRFDFTCSCRNVLDRKLAVAIALSHSTNVKTFAFNTEVCVIERFQCFKTWSSQGKMMEHIFQVIERLALNASIYIYIYINNMCMHHCIYINTY